MAPTRKPQKSVVVRKPAGKPAHHPRKRPCRKQPPSKQSMPSQSRKSRRQKLWPSRRRTWRAQGRARAKSAQLQKKAAVVAVAKGKPEVLKTGVLKSGAAKPGKVAATPVTATPAATLAASAGRSAAAAAAAPKGKRGRASKADSEALSTIERRAPVMPEERQSQLKLLIALGKEQSFLTYSQVNDHLPSEIVDPEQIEDIVNMINDMGIPVYEKAPDSEPLLATENSQPADDEAIEEAAAALAALDAELGRTTDPVRMYMREMGTVELLTREGEISIAKRIEEGLDTVRGSLAYYPADHQPCAQGISSWSRPARAAWST